MGKYNITWSDKVVDFWSENRDVSDLSETSFNSKCEIIKAHPTTFRQALRWKKGRRIFTNPNSDFFTEEADGWRIEAWDVIRKSPQHTWQILTSFPERVIQCLPPDWGNGYQNVWIGVRVQSPKDMHRVYTIGNVPVALRFIYADSLRQQIDFLLHREILHKFGWMILGEHLWDSNGRRLHRYISQKWVSFVMLYFMQIKMHIFVKKTGVALGTTGKLKNFNEGIYRSPA